MTIRTFFSITSVLTLLLGVGWLAFPAHDADFYAREPR